MEAAQETREHSQEQPGKYIDEMAAALERTAVGIPATDRDQACYRVTAECLDSLYDGSVVPGNVPPDFDREIAYGALQLESRDPRVLAGSVAETLTSLAEGGVPDEDSLAEVRKTFERYRQLYAQVKGPIRSEGLAD